MTQLGYEITESILDSEWPRWKESPPSPPKAISFGSINSYFEDGVGQACPVSVLISDTRRSETEFKKATEEIIEKDALEKLKDLPHREYEDGRVKLIQHARLERTRNPSLIRNAKRLFKRKHGRLFCEVCAFDFEVKYGKRGADYIEAHHRLPISEIEASKSIKLTIHDLAMVCSNCHRMLHRVPWITVEHLKTIMSKK